jgi:tetratricopeptide (TPR) repeat protein
LIESLQQIFFRKSNQHCLFHCRTNYSSIKQRLSLSLLNISICLTFLLFSFPVFSQAIKGRILIDKIEYSGTKIDESVIRGIRSTITNDLSKFNSIEVITVEDQEKAVKLIASKQAIGEDASSSKEIANVLSTDYVCTGDVQNTGDVIRIHIRLLKTPSFTVAAKTTIDGKPDNLLKFQDNIVEYLLNNLDIKITDKEKEVLKVFAAKTETAYRYYAQGLDNLYRNPKEALRFFLKALEEDPEYLDAIEDAGNAYLQVNDFESSLSYFEKRKRILEEKNLTNLKEYGNILGNIGMLHFFKENYQTSLEFCEKDKQLKEKLKLNNTESYANTIVNIGSIHYQLGDVSSALSFYSSAIKIYQKLKLDKTYNYANVLINSGVIHKISGKTNEAMSLYLKAEAILNKLKLHTSPMYASLCGNIGMLYYTKKDYPKALTYLLKDRDINKALGLDNTDGYATTLANLGLVLYTVKKYDHALAQYEKAKEIKEELHLTETNSYKSIVNMIEEVNRLR